MHFIVITYPTLKKSVLHWTKIKAKQLSKVIKLQIGT